MERTTLRRPASRLLVKRANIARSPASLEPPPPDERAIDFKSLPVFAGIHTVCLLFKIEDVSVITQRMAKLFTAPIWSPLTGEKVDAWWNAMQRKWHLSTGERISIKDGADSSRLKGARAFQAQSFLYIEFEARWSFTDKSTDLLPFALWQKYCEEYLIPHIEFALDMPDLFSISPPELLRFDLGFDVCYNHPHYLVPTCEEGYNYSLV